MTRTETPAEQPSRAAAPLVFLVRCYQRWLSPMLPPSCRYYPSCSAYAVTALQRFGPLRGSWLAARRLARCHPWAAGGVDHVPSTPASRARSADVGDISAGRRPVS